MYYKVDEKMKNKKLSFNNFSRFAFKNKNKGLIITRKTYKIFTNYPKNSNIKVYMVILQNVRFEACMALKVTVENRTRMIKANLKKKQVKLENVRENVYEAIAFSNVILSLGQ